MKKLALHKVVTLVAAVALGSACIANDALARGGGGGYGGGHGGGGFGGSGYGDGHGGGHIGGYPGYYDGGGGEYVAPAYGYNDYGYWPYGNNPVSPLEVPPDPDGTCGWPCGGDQE